MRQLISCPRQLCRRGLMLLTLILAIWQLGGAGYIYAKAILAQFLLERAWQAHRAGEVEVKPWPWADTWPVARLMIPGQDIEHIVLAGDSGRTLAFGPGYRFGTALPGSPGSSLISGHRDTHFRFLQLLGKGDLILLQPQSGPMQRYRVTDLRIVDSRHAVFLQQSNVARLALVTCYPFDAVRPRGPLRYVVTAEEESFLSARQLAQLMI